MSLRHNRKFKRHEQWNDLIGALGYVDSYGAVHGMIWTTEEWDIPSHSGAFPNNPKYKTWRWDKSRGIECSMLCSISPDEDDFISIKEWLFKRGCLSDWEL